MIASTVLPLELMSSFCANRHSTRPEIVSVTPVDSDDCSSSAIVTPTSRIPSRKTAIIIAKDAGASDYISKHGYKKINLAL